MFFIFLILEPFIVNNLEKYVKIYQVDPVVAKLMDELCNSVSCQFVRFRFKDLPTENRKNLSRLIGIKRCVDCLSQLVGEVCPCCTYVPNQLVLRNKGITTINDLNDKHLGYIEDNNEPTLTSRFRNEYVFMLEYIICQK